MNHIIKAAMRSISDISNSNSIKTKDVRSISSKLYKSIEYKNIENILSLCEELLDEKDWALGVIAYDWAFRVRKQYNEKTFLIFENWLKKYVTGWGNCDDFCTHAFGELLSQNNDYFSRVLEWTNHKDFFVRRASAVILIYPIKKNKYHKLKPFIIADLLMNDDHHLVQKGYGWMLKVLSQYQPERVFQYLLKHQDNMPRTAFRYALEKLSKDQQDFLMKKM